jgi:hypothetical protein
VAMPDVQTMMHPVLALYGDGEQRGAAAGER